MTAARNVPMFDKPDEQPMTLSKTLAIQTNRLRKDQKARWTVMKLKTYRPRQECGCVQHETDGKFGPRRQAKRRRAHPAGPSLELCVAHADLWKDRDADDSGFERDA